MTRYAKLTGRKPQYSKSSAEEAKGNGSRDDVREESSRTGLDTTAESLLGASPSAEIPNGGAVANGKDATTDASEDAAGATAEQRTPGKILKKVKLLKLKAKKTTSKEKKDQLLAQMRQLEKDLHTLNGERGGDKARSRSRDETDEKTLGGYARTEASQGISNPWKAMEAERRAISSTRSAHRRERRIEERESQQRCFACRQLGHSAKDCTSLVSSSLHGDGGKDSVETALVCCYRCGSTEHSLSKCRKPAPKAGPDLPFAHCFICQKRGHLASKCGQNEGRGIYPHGGHCKLCRSVEHLAKDCPLNEAQRSGGSTAASNASVGWMADVQGHATGGSSKFAAADEDDFHAMTRKRHALDQVDTRQQRVHAKEAPHSRVADNGGLKKRKIVSF